jgi:hypothetical protein
VWFRRGRLLIVSPDSLGKACPLSGRNSTYRPVQISAAGSLPEDREWHSGEETDGISSFADKEVLEKYSGKPLELPLIFWITRNIRTALQALAVQS